MAKSVVSEWSAPSWARPDAQGRRMAEQIPGSEHVLPADAVVMAFGFRPHSMEWLAAHDVKLDKQGRVIAPESTDNAFQTSNPKSLRAAILSVVPI